MSIEVEITIWEMVALSLLPKAKRDEIIRKQWNIPTNYVKSRMVCNAYSREKGDRTIYTYEAPG